MKTFKLEGKPRTELGKKAVNALRRQDLIPAILYGNEAVTLPFSGSLSEGESMVETQGKGMVVTNFTVSKDAVRKLIYTPEVFIVELSIGNKTQTAILKDMQIHPVTDDILHLDFLVVTPEKPMVAELPVILDGFAVGVRAGGKLNLVLRKLKVKGLMSNMPENLHVNVEKLELGKSIQVKHLSFENLELLNAPNNVVCAVAITRGAIAAAAAAAAADKK